MPDLSAEQVRQYVNLGKFGRELVKAGEVGRAEMAFRTQISIFPPNAGPFVSLALLEAARGRPDAAVVQLRAAVVRGFTDLRTIARSEAWTGVGRPTGFLKLLDALPALAELERDWPEWDTIPFTRTPRSLAEVETRHAGLVTRIEGMAPALGERLRGLWLRTIDRGTASRIEAYVHASTEADDLEPALERLLTLYTGGPLRRWERRSAAVSRRLIRVAKLALERFPQSEMRPAALVALAVGKNAVRDKKGLLHPLAAREIRAALGEVTTAYPSSPVMPAAVVGLVRTELDAGRPQAAEAIYRDFREAHADDRERAARVRDELGELALRVGGLPEFSATTLDGRTLDREVLAGKVAVVDFWATWCGPCVEELPSLRRIAQRHGDEVVVVGINLDEPDELPREGLRDWITRQGVPGDQVHDGLSWESELVRTFGVKEIPFTVVVGRDGAVLAVNEQGKRLEKTVRTALRTGQSSSARTVPRARN